MFSAPNPEKEDCETAFLPAIGPGIELTNGNILLPQYSRGLVIDTNQAPQGYVGKPADYPFHNGHENTVVDLITRNGRYSRQVLLAKPEVFAPPKGLNFAIKNSVNSLIQQGVLENVNPRPDGEGFIYDIPLGVYAMDGFSFKKEELPQLRDFLDQGSVAKGKITKFIQTINSVIDPNINNRAETIAKVFNSIIVKTGLILESVKGLPLNEIESWQNARFIYLADPQEFKNM